jgi:hypothetical protein
MGLSSRFVAKWLPLALRIFVAASLWLIVAPLLTNYLYHGWMIRPSSILTRWKYELILSDIVSGAVTSSVIIISFLSLLSFADFLRVHWQQAPREEEDLDGRQLEPMPGLADGKDENDISDVDETAIDNNLSDYLERHHVPEQGSENDEIVDERREENASISIEQQNDVVGEQNTSKSILRNQAAQLRDLALEREARKQAVAAAEREWVPLNHDLPVALAGGGGGDADNRELAAHGLHFDDIADDDLEDDEDPDDDEDDDDDVERDGMGVDDDDNHDGLNWGQGDLDDGNEIQGQRQPEEAEQDEEEAFDPMDAVLQDDQVVSRCSVRRLYEHESFTPFILNLFSTSSN